MDGGMPRFVNYPQEVAGKITGAPRGQTNAASVSWNDVRILRDKWPRNFIVKGILSPDDAKLAIESGVDAIIVSNHGGRNLDAVVAAIDVLPEIVSAIGGRIPVLFDSGVRRGSDVIKALALGANAILIGRPTLYGLAAAGEPGVTRALTILNDEIDRTLGLIGCCNVRVPSMSNY